MKRPSVGRPRRGPVLCDGGHGEHAALNPQVVTSGKVRSRVLCANCALRWYSDAVRLGWAYASEPLALVLELARASRRGAAGRRQPLAAVLDMEERRKA
jgi:hypothetical protein